MLRRAVHLHNYSAGLSLVACRFAFSSDDMGNARFTPFGTIGDSNHFVYSLANSPDFIMRLMVSSTSFLNSGSSLRTVSDVRKLCASNRVFSRETHQKKSWHSRIHQQTVTCRHVDTAIRMVETDLYRCGEQGLYPQRVVHHPALLIAPAFRRAHNAVKVAAGLVDKRLAIAAGLNHDVA